ncbi:RNA polymerase sigma factor [Streptomyces sp. NPDC055210]
MTVTIAPPDTGRATETGNRGHTPPLAQPTPSVRSPVPGPGSGRHRGRRADDEPYSRGSDTAPGRGRHRRTADATRPRPASGQVGSIAYETRFERDVLPLADPLYRAASSVTGDPAEAEDLVLDVFTKAYAALARLLDGDRRVWLFYLLAAAFSGPHPTVCVLPPAPGIQDGTHGSAPDRFVPPPDADVRAAFLALPKGQRLAVYLAAVEDFGYEEIAGIMRVSPSIAAYWLHDAPPRLRVAAGPRAAAAEGGVRPRQPRRSRTVAAVVLDDEPLPRVGLPSGRRSATRGRLLSSLVARRPARRADAIWRAGSRTLRRRRPVAS